jgi:cytochrome c biogenesis protein CcmG/thiol:disulfide interchange protein DsbE
MLGGVSRRRWALTVLLAVALVAVAIPALRSAPGRVLRPAPALPGEALSGRAVSLASLRGRPVFVNFWASWCNPCNREARALESFARLGRQHAVVVGVDLNDTLSGARVFVHRYGLTYPILRAGGEAVSSAFGLETLPTTFVIDRRGRIAATLNGPQTVATLTAALAAAAD